MFDLLADVLHESGGQATFLEFLCGDEGGESGVGDLRLELCGEGVEGRVRAWGFDGDEDFHARGFYADFRGWGRFLDFSIQLKHTRFILRFVCKQKTASGSEAATYKDVHRNRSSQNFDSASSSRKYIPAGIGTVVNN